MGEPTAWDSFLTGASTLAAITPLGLALGVTPHGAPEGWSRADTLEAVTGLDVSDRVDASQGGAVEATATQLRARPLDALARGTDVAAEVQTNVAKGAGWLPSWWQPWMTKAAWIAGGLAAAAIVAGPYVAPMLAARSSSKG